MNEETGGTLNVVGMLNQLCKMCQRSFTMYADHRARKRTDKHLKERQICKKCELQSVFWRHFQRQHCNQFICQAYDNNRHKETLSLPQIENSFCTIMPSLTIVQTIPGTQKEYIDRIDSVNSPTKSKMDDYIVHLKTTAVSHLLIVQGLLTMKKFHEENYAFDQSNIVLTGLHDDDNALVYGWMKGWETDIKSKFLGMLNLQRKANNRVESNRTRTRRFHLRSRIV